LNNEKYFIQQIKANEKIIHKIINLYVDDAEDEKDLYQEVLMQAWKSFKNFKGESKFSTWLYKITLNTTLTFRRKERRVIKTEGAELKASDAANERREDYEELYYLIKQLNAVDKMIMTLHLDGFKNHEISEMTGLDANHINVKLHRLKKRIVEQLKSRSYGS
jgi:RNA polymerase sigma-70 factor (ECF subfamily)